MVMMCLGADVELSISAKSMQTKEASPNSLSQAHTIVTLPLEPSFEPMDTALADQQLYQIENEDPDTVQPQAGPLEKNKEPAKVQKASAVKKQAVKEDLFVTLIHGDVLMFTGDHFEVCRPVLILAY